MRYKLKDNHFNSKYNFFSNMAYYSREISSRIDWAPFDYYVKKIYSKIEWAPIAASRELLSTFARISGWKYVSSHVLMQTTALIIGNSITFSLNRMFAEKFQDLDQDFQNFAEYGKTDLSNNSDIHWVDFERKIWEVAPYIGYYIISSAISSLINGYFERRLARKLVKDLQNKKLLNQTGYGLSHNSETDFISRNLDNDSVQLTSDGVKMLTNLFTASQNAMFSIAELASYSRWINISHSIRLPDLIAASALYGFTTQFVSNYISKVKTKYSTELNILNSKLTVIKIHDANHIKSITERSGEEFTLKRYDEFQANIRSINEKYHIANTVHLVWKNFHRIANDIFKYVVVGRRLYNQTLPHESRGLTFNAIDNVEPLFGWKEHNSDSINTSKVLVKRINKFLDAEQELLNKPKLLKFKTNSEKSLKIKNFKLKIGDDRLLVEIPEYEFSMGVRYLITGKSGNGKSTLLAKINNIVNTGEINASGTITEPREIKKVMLTQIDFFPKYTTLLESISYPNEVPTDPIELNELKKKIISLFKEIEIDNVADKNNPSNESIIDLLNEIQDWDVRLSGGQKKKIQIISAIIKKPDILISDEAFTGLDTGSIGLVHRMLMKYLPHTMILNVDHHGVTNNKLSGKEFCNKHLNFTDHKITEVKTGHSR